MDEKKFHIRITLLSFVFILALAAIFGKSIFLTFFVDEVKVYRHKNKILRGVIYDKRGLELAVSQEAYDIGVQPKKAKNPQEIAGLIGPILKIKPSAILKKFKKYKKRFFYLKRAATKQEYKLAKGLELEGMQFNRQLSRVYPNSKLAGQLIGFTNIDNQGIEGVEKKYDSLLSRPADDSNLHGFNLHLTVDGLVQFKVEQILTKYLEESQAEMGMAIFMEVKTGNIVAMATVPGFDPNNFGRFVPSRRTNYAIRHNYEPGSTVKVFVAAALLAEGLIKTNDKFYCNGSVELADTVIKCTAKHGNLNMADILKHSCNAGIIHAAQKISPQKLYYYLRHFGFGMKTEVDLIGETSGRLGQPKNWNSASRHFIPIGQSIQITPIQLVSALASIANQGTLYRPQIQSRYTNSFGETSKTFLPIKKRRVLPETLSRLLINYMTTVVSDGTGRLAKDAALTIAGKTGTGQIAGKQGYIKGAYTASFMGLFPTDEPEYAGLVIFDRPVAPYSGGGLAAPAFAEIVDAMANLLHDNSGAEFQQIAPLTMQLGKLAKDKVPNFTGKSLRESLVILGHIGLPYTVDGQGYVYAQEPAPGMATLKTKQVRLFFKEP